MRQHMVLLLGVPLVGAVLPGHTEAFPITGNEVFQNSFLTPAYIDGFCIAPCAAGAVAYIQYSTDNGQTWSDILPAVRADVLAGVNEGTTQIRDPRSGAVFQGDAATLVQHTAQFLQTTGYGIAFNGSSMTVDVQINFNWDGIDQQDQQTKLAQWEGDIEDWWSKRFAISKDSGEFIFPIVVDVTTAGRQGNNPFDQNVTVMPGSGATNENNWFFDDGAQTVAHEFGHMIGLYDEYWGGALDANLDLDPTHLMGALIGNLSPPSSGLKAAYFQSFETWLQGRDPDPSQTYDLVAVPEPGTLALLGFALAVLGLGRFSPPGTRRAVAGMSIRMPDMPAAYQETPESLLGVTSEREVA